MKEEGGSVGSGRTVGWKAEVESLRVSCRFLHVQYLRAACHSYEDGSTGPRLTAGEKNENVCGHEANRENASKEEEASAVSELLSKRHVKRPRKNQ